MSTDVDQYADQCQRLHMQLIRGLVERDERVLD